MRTLSLFSGIGAHDLGLTLAGFEIVGQIEIDPFCRKVLKKHWPDVPKHGDICSASTKKTLQICGPIECIAGSFPCQDLSVAGKQAGLSGKKSGLWTELLRFIKEIKPRWCIIENVPPLRTKGADTVFSALEECGYSCWAFVVGAVHTGASHYRQRVWILAHLNSELLRIQPRRGGGQEWKEALLNRFASENVEYTGGEGHKDWWISGGLPPAKSKPTDTDTNVEHANSNTRRAKSSVERKHSVVETVEIIKKPESSGLRLQHGRTIKELADSIFSSFPLPQGYAQWDWEEPRVISKSEVVSSNDGVTSRLVRRHIGERLRGVGNANPPINAYVIGRALLQIEKVVFDVV